MSVFPLFYITYIDVFGEIGDTLFFAPSTSITKSQRHEVWRIRSTACAD